MFQSKKDPWTETLQQMIIIEQSEDCSAWRIVQIETLQWMIIVEQSEDCWMFRSSESSAI